jgi:glutaredoxin
MFNSIHLNAKSNALLLANSPPSKSGFFEGKFVKARLYLKGGAIGPKVINTVVHIKNLLQLKGINEEDVEEIVIDQNDEEKLRQIQEQANATELPIVFVHDVAVGVITLKSIEFIELIVSHQTVNDLEEWVVSGKIDSIIDDGTINITLTDDNLLIPSIE